MKKLFVALISAVLCFSLFAFVGCGKNSEIPSPDDYQVGYQITPYPNFSFNYVAEVENETYTVSISSLTITLTEKNVIEPNQTISGEFYRFSFQVVIKATTDSILTNRETAIRLLRNDTLTMLKSTIQEDGTIEWAQVWHTLSIPQVCFSDIIIYNQ